MRKFSENMPASPKDLALRKTLLVTLAIVIVGAIAFTMYQNRPWTVPQEARQVKNPLPTSEAALQSIRPIYHDKCAVCHGERGKGDGHDAKLYDPLPTNFTDANHINAATDGELFYKLSEGRRPMPGFKKRLTEEQRWQLVLLIRSFLPPPPSASSASNH